MKKRIVLAIVAVLLVALVILAAWAYSYVSPMTPRASDAWSRGRVLGRTPVSRPPALQLADDGTVFLSWPDLEGQLVLAHIGTEGQVLANWTLFPDLVEARDPQLRLGRDGRLHLLWRQGEEEGNSLWYARLEQDGTVVGEPLCLADSGVSGLDAPQLVGGIDGRMHAFWVGANGLYWAALDDGLLVAEPARLAAEGESLAARPGEDGIVHLVWQQRYGANTHGIFYAVLDPQSELLEVPEEMAQVFLRTGQRIESLGFGADLETGYVLWVVHDLRDLASQGRYVFFPLGLPRQKRSGMLHLQQGTNPAGLYPLEGQAELLWVALSEEVPDRSWSIDAQIAITTLAREEAPEYEIWGLGPGGRVGLLAPVDAVHDSVSVADGQEEVVTASTRPSLQPVLARDDAGHFYLAWLETGGFNQYRVVFASTTPGVMQSYNAVTMWDIVDAFFSGVLQFAGVLWLALPILFLWSMVAFSILALYHLITGEEELDTWRSRAVLLVVLGVEVGLALAFPPSMHIARLPWHWAALVACAALAALITHRVVRRDTESQLFIAFFLFTLINILLQLILYTLLLSLY